MSRDASIYKENRSWPRPRPRGENKHGLAVDMKVGLGVFLPVKQLKAKPGDLIEINRTVYSYWALYIGDGMAVHVNMSPECGYTSRSAEVRLSRLRDISKGSLMRVNNKTVPARERGLVPLPQEKIIRNARGVVGKNVYYNALSKNSEHYVTEWRYGEAWSDQAATILNVVKNSSSPTSPLKYQCSPTSQTSLLAGLSAIFQ